MQEKNTDVIAENPQGATCRTMRLHRGGHLHRHVHHLQGEYRDSSDRVSSRSPRDRRDSRERDAGTASRSTLEKTLDFWRKGLDELRAQVQASKESDRGRGVSFEKPE